MSLATCESSILGFAAGSAMLTTKRLQTGQVRCKRVLGSQNSDIPLQALSSMPPGTSWLYVRACDMLACLVKDARSHACNSALCHAPMTVFLCVLMMQMVHEQYKLSCNVEAGRTGRIKCSREIQACPQRVCPLQSVGQPSAAKRAVISFRLKMLPLDRLAGI